MEVGGVEALGWIWLLRGVAAACPRVVVGRMVGLVWGGWCLWVSGVGLGFALAGLLWALARWRPWRLWRRLSFLQGIG